MVTLTGTGFVTGATTVTFGGTTIPAHTVTFDSTTQIKVTSPAHAAGTVTVKVTTAGGDLALRLALHLRPPDHHQGHTGGRQDRGWHNGHPHRLELRLGGHHRHIRGDHNRRPHSDLRELHPDQGALALPRRGHRDSEGHHRRGHLGPGEHFTYEAAPDHHQGHTLAGPTAGGTTVTLTGTGFVTGATKVTFGGTTIRPVTFVSTTQIKVHSPSHGAGTVTVKATTAGGTSASGEHFTYEAVPTITKVTPSAGPTAGGTTVTLTGTGFVSGATTVTFGGTTIPAHTVTFVSATEIKVTSPVPRGGDRDSEGHHRRGDLGLR